MPIDAEGDLHDQGVVVANLELVVILAAGERRMYEKLDAVIVQVETGNHVAGVGDEVLDVVQFYAIVPEPTLQPLGQREDVDALLLLEPVAGLGLDDLGCLPPPFPR